MERVESKGIVLYNRNFREQDKLVKLFTEQFGKRMFFVKRASKSKIAAVIQPLTVAHFLLKIADSGLSYIEDYKETTVYKEINNDLFKLSYATYLLALADSAIEDQLADPNLYSFLIRLLDLMETGLDYEILTNIFEIQILDRFGVRLNFDECVFCHRSGLAFDFSYRYSGVLCPEHYHEDDRRSHLDPNILFLINQFQGVRLADLQTISVKQALKEDLRRFIDSLYDNYVGIHLKSKQFIDDLTDWGAIMKDKR